VGGGAIVTSDEPSNREGVFSDLRFATSEILVRDHPSETARVDGARRSFFNRLAKNAILSMAFRRFRSSNSGENRRSVDLARLVPLETFVRKFSSCIPLSDDATVGRPNVTALNQKMAHMEGRVMEHAQTLIDIRETLGRFEQRVDARFAGVDHRLERLDQSVTALRKEHATDFRWLVGIQITTTIAILAALIQAVLSK
jgi:hypothetical protein